MPTVRISEEMYYLLYNRAKNENQKVYQVLDMLLHKVLWNEPALLFRGKHYQVEPDLFGHYEPKPGEIEE